MSEQNLTYKIIAAQQGFITVYDSPGDREVQLAYPIIAWRIETLQSSTGGFASSCIPITFAGEVGGDFLGIQAPDKTITCVNGDFYKSLEEFQADKYRAE